MIHSNEVPLNTVMMHSNEENLNPGNAQYLWIQ